MELSDVLINPRITEKTTMLKDDAGQVAFMVDPRANKIEIKQAVEKAFDVKVTAVNIVRRKPLNRERQGRVIGKISGWKKAYVTLAKDNKIEFFEGV